MSQVLLLSLFFICKPKLDIQDILEKPFVLDFLGIFSFLVWTLDEEITSFNVFFLLLLTFFLLNEKSRLSFYLFIIYYKS